MRLSTDHHSVIGSAHLKDGKPCQDYTTSGVAASMAYAIACDGCSGGKRTEVGAMIYALTTAKTVLRRFSTAADISNPDAFSLMLSDQRAGDIVARDHLGLSQVDMLATCITAAVTPQGGFVHMQGDGVYALLDTAGFISLYRVEAAQNMPPYPAYRDDGFAAYVAEQGGDLSAPLLTITEAVGQISDTEYFTEQTRTVSLGEGIGGTRIEFDRSTLDTLACIAVFTDGVTQIDGMDWKQAVLALLAFKSSDGPYARRRLNRFMQERRKVGKGPEDDVGYAVIRMDYSDAQAKEG